MSEHKWIQGAVPSSHKGLLHKKLHVKAGQKISEKKLKKAEKSKSTTLRREAQFAENVRK